MTKITNPYETPKSSISPKNTANGDVIRLYSPTQAGIAAFLGGPLAGAYVIRKNFLALDDADNAKNFGRAGLILTVLLVLIIPFLPEKMPNAAIGIVWVVLTTQVLKKFHPSKEQIESSPEYDFRSNWTVVGAAIVSMLITATFLVIWSGIAAALDLISLS